MAKKKGKAKKKEPGELTPRQQRFVQEYLKAPNGAQAARAAGYAAKTANREGARLLSNVGILAAIKAGQTAVASSADVDARRVLAELALIGFSDIGDILDFSAIEPRLKPANAIPAAARRAISSVKVKRYYEGSGDDAREVEVTEFKLWSKEGALRDLGRHLKLFTDRLELTGEDLDRAIARELEKLAGNGEGKAAG